MQLVPTKFFLVAGRGEGGTPLNAFDAALRAAGVGHLNLLKVTSILPPGARHVPSLAIPAGSLVPAAYGYLTAAAPGKKIAAAVGVGVSTGSYGVVMEFEGFCGSREAEEAVARMVEEGFRERGLVLKEVLVRAVEHEVKRIGSVFAGVIFWY